MSESDWPQLLDDEQRNFLRMTGIAKEQSVNCDLWVGDTVSGDYLSLLEDYSQLSRSSM